MQAPDTSSDEDSPIRRQYRNYFVKTTVHELLHAAGLPHEHQRYDRAGGSKNRTPIQVVNHLDWVLAVQFLLKAAPSHDVAQSLPDYNVDSIMHYEEAWGTLVLWTPQWTERNQPERMERYSSAWITPRGTDIATLRLLYQPAATMGGGGGSGGGGGGGGGGEIL